MAVILGGTSIDNKGKYSGNFIKNECVKRKWYNKPWTKIIRPTGNEVTNIITCSMEQACNNNLIKCSSNKKANLYTISEQYNFNLSKIDTECFTNSLELIAVCVRSAGVYMPQISTEKQFISFCSRSGKFAILEEEKYLNSSEYLKCGDILLSDGYYMIVLEDNNTVIENNPYKDKIIETARVLNNVRVRTGPGPQYKPLGQIDKHNMIEILSALDNNWYQIIWKNGYAYVNAEYFKCTNNNSINKKSIIVNQKRQIKYDTNIKKSPDKSSSTIGIAKKDSFYIIIKVNNDWGCLSNGGWVPLDATIKL